MKRFIISDTRNKGTRNKKTFYVVARPGWMRCRDGTYQRDGSLKGGPEWSEERAHAFVFKSHSAAARVLSKCVTAVISEIEIQ